MMNTEKLIPIIQMEKEDWERLREDAEKNDFEDIDFYGNVIIGGVCASLYMGEVSKKGKPDRFSWMFIKGFDDGYGETEDGMPYALADGNCFDDFPLECETFEEYKEKLSENFLRYCNNINVVTADDVPKECRGERESLFILGTLVPGCTKDFRAILEGANGTWV